MLDGVKGGKINESIWRHYNNRNQLLNYRPFKSDFYPIFKAVKIRPKYTNGRSQVPYAENRDSNNGRRQDRKSTRLNSSHVSSSYAVFCLKKKHKCGGVGAVTAGGQSPTSGEHEATEEELSAGETL